MTSKNGVNFVPRNQGHTSLVILNEALPPAKSETLFTQRDVDIRYDRMSKQLLMVQGDVGANQIFWSLSDDLGAPLTLVLRYCPRAIVSHGSVAFQD